MLLPLALHGAQPTPATVDDDTRTFLDGYVRHAMSESGIPGLVLVVTTSEQPLIEAAYGYADPGRRLAMDVERSGLRVGALSTVITALAASQTEGLDLAGVDLTPLIGDALPAEAGPLTAEDLLAGRSPYSDRLRGRAASSEHPWRTIGELFRRIPPLRLDLPEGTANRDPYQWSLLGLALERRRGVRFEDLVVQEVLAPRGMDWSSFEQWSTPPWMEPWLSRGHDGDGALPVRPLLAVPAEGLTTTGGDMGRLMRSLLSDGPGSDGALPALHPRRHPAWGEQRSVSGAVPGFVARLSLYPELGIGIFVAHNRDGLGTVAGIGPAGRVPAELEEAVLERLAVPADRSGRATAPLATVDPAIAGRYRPVTLHPASAERFRELFTDHALSVEPGRIRFRGETWTPEGESRFRGASTGRLLEVAEGALLIEGRTWLPTSWGRSSAGTWAALTSNLITVLAVLVLLPIWWWRRRRPGLEHPWSRTGVRLTLAICLADLVLLSALVALGLRTEVHSLYVHRPQGLVLGSLLAVPATVLNLTLGIMVLQSWVAGRGPARARRWFTLLVLALLPFHLWLASWNLLGPFAP